MHLIKAGHAVAWGDLHGDLCPVPPEKCPGISVNTAKLTPSVLALINNLIIHPKRD